MRSRVTLFAVLLAVPVLALIASQEVLMRYDRDLQAGLAKQYPEVPAERRATVTVALLCASGEASKDFSENACPWHARFRGMRFAAVMAALAGLGWIGVIAVAGRVARRDRAVLVRVFRPGLHATNALVVALIALHGALAVATLYVAESLLIGGFHPKLLLLVAAGAVVGVIAIAKAAFSIVKPATIAVLGRPLDREDAPELWRLVDDVATRADVSPPDRIVAGLDLNFFVTEAAVQCPGAELTGRVLFVSLPLSRILSREELGSVIGHELGHFKGQDTEFSRRFYPVYRGTTNALEALADTDAGLLGGIALIPASAVLVFLLESFAVAANTIGRERELAADAVGAVVAGATTTASALTKVHAFTRHWEPVHQAMVDAVMQRAPLENLSARFAATVAAEANATALVGLDEARLRHPMDSHPTLAARLEHLGVTLADVHDPALDVTPARAAIHLIRDAEKIESELSAAGQQLVAHSLGVAV
jgi:Zn-dependent protease with chaperone function